VVEHVPEILFVDDNPGDSELVEEAFRQYAVEARFRKVEDGQKALEVLRGAAEAGNPLPDLVLLDVNLPVKSGHEVLREIRADPKLRDVEVVMLSASERRRDIEESERLHAASYVIKPSDWDEYLVMVRSFQQRLKKKEAEANALAPPQPLKALEQEPEEP
jgi:two-component system response regulator